MKKKVPAILLLSLAVISAVFAGGVNERLIGSESVPEYAPDPEERTEAGISEILYSIGNIYQYLDRNFLYDIDNEKVEEALLSGLIEGLDDKYSYYVPKDESEEFNEGLTGEYVGVGTYVSKMNPKFADFSDPETYMLKIISPFPGGPADRAGLRPGDLISHINGKDLADMDAHEASRCLRGKKGESLTLSVVRGTAEFEITLMPENVTAPNSSYTMIDDEIGYLYIQTFNQMSTKSVSDAISDLMDMGMKKLIIDLRNNAGGTVNTCLEITNLFQSGGTIVTVEYSKKSNQPRISYQAEKEVMVPKWMPITILVNGGTASASEIMTGSLKDNGRATVIGSQTFGKGIMQDIMPYNDGFISYTVARYLTPNGTNIHETGITPDILVEEEEYTDEEMKAYEDFFKSGEPVMKWVDENPEYTVENIEAFADAHKDTGVPHDLLCLLARNEYVYRMPVSERPIVDLVYDTALLRAIEEMEK